MLKSLLILLSISLSTFAVMAQSDALTVATFNIRYDNPNDAPDTWENRKDIVANLILFHGFDIFGIQEGLFHQVNDLDKRLPNHRFVGVGRDDGGEKGEFSAIFYDHQQFQVLNSGTFWLAPETDHPNKGWDAALPRICSWAKMVAIGSGEHFYVFNTHFDHRGVEARKQSARVILEKIREINTGSLPVILTGDFNVGQETETYEQLRTAEGMKDSFDAAETVYANNGTTNSFDTSKSTDRIIDHIFVSEDIEVRKYGILTDTYHGRFPSDHFPVMAVISW
ncbi:Metal-dependent hydrolase, endonuclease/exonuclease/phosphatase family [Cyclobacterium lianum]|uniref:Metal-dependent hydrolase, endonuclease/exonuclease/phosphatase family n=1 Tax=Cyclobacterium lianum TaxID=388280 RepID=A0A1M7K7Y3_9BACT|nr:endonuclease/exonuclease/phosphatase family protein [Cyclobacterium lianum]SHM61301.1 Metal-dependent hydrolase, endonuclease/exonuclease/phosphatase family [Cyclobacterium lianum]